MGNPGAVRELVEEVDVLLSTTSGGGGGWTRGEEMTEEQRAGAVQVLFNFVLP